jgi:hypothetical protein
MPLRDQVMQERSLDLFYDTAPNPFELALFDDDPDLGGVELAGNGYARGDVTTANWFPADEGKKATEPIPVGAPTGPWNTARWAGLYDPVAGAWADVIPLEEELDVTDAGDPPTISIAVFYDTNLD